MGKHRLSIMKREGDPAWPSFTTFLTFFVGTTGVLAAFAEDLLPVRREAYASRLASHRVLSAASGRDR